MLNTGALGSADRPALSGVGRLSVPLPIRPQHANISLSVFANMYVNIF